MALITLARATELVPNFNTADNAVMQDIVDACSDLIERYCNRTFAVTTYDTVVDGSGYQNLLLDNYPIISIDRVMTNPMQVIAIRNTDQNAQRASYRLDSTSLYLTSVKNGTVTTRTLTRSDYATFSDLATGINVFSADGWNASALGIYGSWRTADLYAPQGGFDCRWQGNAYVMLHSWSFPSFLVNGAIGEIAAPWKFVRGYQNYRVVYTAGFSTVPLPVQEACAELAVAVYNARNINANLQAENFGGGGASYTTLADKSFGNLSTSIKEGLSQYRNRRVVKYKVY